MTFTIHLLYVLQVQEFLKADVVFFFLDLVTQTLVLNFLLSTFTGNKVYVSNTIPWAPKSVQH